MSSTPNLMHLHFGRRWTILPEMVTHLVPSLYDKVEIIINKQTKNYNKKTKNRPCGGIRPPKIKNCESPFDKLSDPFGPISLRQN